MQRKLDELGRLIIPREMTRQLGITPKTVLDVNIEGERIIIKKAGESCVFCGTTDNIITGFCVCRECAQRVSDVLNLAKE